MIKTLVVWVGATLAILGIVALTVLGVAALVVWGWNLFAPAIGSHAVRYWEIVGLTILVSLVWTFVRSLLPFPTSKR